MNIKKLKPGMMIKVKALHYRSGYKTAIRKIKTIEPLGVTVGLFGWTHFYLKPHEIIEIVKP